jgi:hypothetical protein
MRKGRRQREVVYLDLPSGGRERVRTFRALWRSHWGTRPIVSSLFYHWLGRQITALRAQGARLPEEPEKPETFTGVEDVSPRVDD